MRRVLVTLLAGCLILTVPSGGQSDETPKQSPRDGGDAKADQDGRSGGAARRKRGKRPRRGRRKGGGAQEKAGAPAKPGEMVKRLDANGDGVLSTDEIPQPLRERFGKLDTNRDGSIDGAELKAGRDKLRANPDGPGPGGPPGGFPGAPPGGPSGRPPGPPPGAGGPRFSPDMAFQRFDKDGDGKLAGDEIPEPMRQRIGRADSDGDGAISKEELTTAMGRMRARMEGEGGQRLRDAYGASDISAKQHFNEQDVDADGRVVRSEAKGPLASQFDKLDVNRDGKLDALEVENGLKATP